MTHEQKPQAQKKYMFQYAYSEWHDTKILEDTGLITKEEAISLWRRYLPDFISRLLKNKKPEI